MNESDPRPGPTGSSPGPSPGPSLGPSPIAAGERNLSVDEARAAIAAALVPLARHESRRVPLAAADGRVLAEDVLSPIDVPAHDNSAMDGYAFAGRALGAAAPTVLRAAGTVYAGRPHAGTVAAGQCLRIMTGAVMPAGTDTVVPLELVQVKPGPGGADDGEVVIPPGAIQPGENRRRRGEDLARGRPALVAGRVLKPADIGLAASLGLTELAVMRPLKVALFSTGDEVTEPGAPLAEGAIYDSNRFSLAAAMRRLGVAVVDLGLVRDDRAALSAVVERALGPEVGADAVVTSGGVSAGDADYTRELLAAHGEIAFWKVAMRPGRPFAFGPLRRSGAGRPAWLFALPGNPVAALVTFYAFVQEALRALGGATPEPRPVLVARSAVAIRKRPGRTEFQRALLAPAQGLSGSRGWTVHPSGSQGAGVLRSMSEANALIVLEHDRGSVAAGDEVVVWPFEGLQ